MLTVESLNEDDQRLVLKAYLFRVTVSIRSFVLYALAHELVSEDDDIDDPEENWTKIGYIEGNIVLVALITNTGLSEEYQ